jgi:predicted esterase
MKREKTSLALLVSCLVTASCSSEPAETADAGLDAAMQADAGTDLGTPQDAGSMEVPGTKVYFSLPISTDSRKFFSFPFPTDLRLKADGHVDLSGFPLREGMVDEQLTNIERETTGWATQGAAYFRFDAPLDEVSFPAVAQTMSVSSPVFLINVDEKSPDRGAATPLLFKFYKDSLDYVSKNVLAIIPESGFPLAPGAKHAAVITRKVRGADGKPLGSPAAFEETKLPTPSANPDVEKARALHAPVYAYLETLGVNRADVAAMTVFTTQDPCDGMRRIRDWLQDDLNLPQPVPAGFKHIGASGSYHRYEGTFTTKMFQKGSPPYMNSDSGYFIFDGDGDPVPQRDEEVRFALTVPAGTSPAGGWPFIQYVHGTGGDYDSFISIGHAENLAQEGLAMISFDQPLHGARNTGNWDESITTFNVQNLPAMRDNFRQGALDSVVLLRMMKKMTVPSSVSHTGTAIAFNSQKTYFFGHSQGGLTGPLFVAVEPGIYAALFSEGGGRFGVSVLEKTEPVDIPSIVKYMLGSEDPLDLFHPIINILQIGAEPSDPVNYARHFIRRPPGSAPIHILMTEGTKDPYTPPHAIEALATAAFLNLATPVFLAVPQMALRGLNPIAPPFSSNALSESGGLKATGALIQYLDEGHFAVYHNAQAIRQYRHFFKTMATTGTPEIRD